MKRLKQILVILMVMVSTALLPEIAHMPYKDTTRFVGYAEESEVLAEDDYEDFHWKVTADGKLTIFPKEEGTNAEINDFYMTLENPDPLDINNHYMEVPTPQPWNEYCGDITSVVIEEGITSIGAYAFDSMMLSSVFIADSVVDIEKKSFYATSIENIKWSQGLRSIGESAFQGLKIKELDLPESLKNIGDSAFRNCTGISSLTLPDSLKNIGEFAFANCSSISNISLPDRLETLSQGSFYGCKALTSVTFGNGITEIPWDCFSECSSLKSVVINGNISVVGTTAFSHCSSLSYAYLGKNVNIIRGSAFGACPNLEKIIIINPDTEILTNAIDTTKCTIYGAANSTAFKYANRYKEISPFEVYGDVNFDGDFSIADLLTLQKWLANDVSVKIESWQHGDFCTDGKLNVFDLCCMKKKLIDWQESNR